MLRAATRIANFVQSLLTSLAILVGGGWAVYTFWWTQSPQALVDIETLKDRCLRKGSLDIKIVDNIKSYPQLKDTIVGAVEFKNVGTRPVLLDLANDHPIRISKVEFTDNGTIAHQTISQVVDLEFYRAPSVNSTPLPAEAESKISILPGRTVSEPFVAKVKSNGWYMIDFWGGKRDIETTDATCSKSLTDAKELPEFAWEATAIVLVSDPSLGFEE
jgi:hypothetical protein